MTLVLDARTATDHFPGIGRYVVSLLSALKQIAPDLDLTLLHDPSAASTRLTLPDFHRIACPISPFTLRQQWSVPHVLRRAGATLYHSPYYLMPYRPGVPTVFTCYDLIPLIYPEYFTPTQRLVYRLAHVLALQTASVTIAISQSTRADLQHLFRIAPRQIVAISLAAEARFSPQSPGAITSVRHKYALPERYGLYLGSNKPHKNLVRLMDAWKASNTQAQTSKVKLVIAGHWEERYPQARQRAEQIGLKDEVVFAGPVDEVDLPALYCGALLFVFPSLYEGFGLPVLEAMACGVPVACANTSSLPEVAGEAALLFDPTNVESAAEALRRLLDDANLRADLRERGIRQAELFSWKRTAEMTLSIYNSQLEATKE